MTNGRVIFQRGLERLRHIVDVIRRESGMRTRHWQDRSEFEQGGELVIEVIVRSEDDRRLEAGNRQILGRHDRLFTRALGEQVLAWPFGGVCPQRAHVQQALDPGRPAGIRYLARQFGMDGAEALAGIFMQDADQIDDRIAAAKLILQDRGIVNVRFDQLGAGQHGNFAMPLRMAGQHPECIAPVGQPRGQMPTNKTSAAQYTNLLNFHACACSSLVLSPPVAE